MEKVIRMGAFTRDEGACYRVPKDCTDSEAGSFVLLQLVRCKAVKSLMKCITKKHNRERVFVKGDIVDILILPYQEIDSIDGDVWIIVNKTKRDTVTSWKRSLNDIKDHLEKIVVINKAFPIVGTGMIYSSPRHKPSDPMIKSYCVQLDEERRIYVDASIFQTAEECVEEIESPSSVPTSIVPYLNSWF